MIRTAILALALAGPASAADFGIELHGKAEHADVGPYNERNPGIGLFIRQGTLYGHVGTYRNSYREQSTYIAVEWLPLQSRWIDAGIGGGSATGYDAHRSGPPIAAYFKAHAKITPKLYAAIRHTPPIRDQGTYVTRGLTTASIGWEWQ